MNLNYNMAELYVDGVKGTVVPGSGNTDNQICPIGLDLTYHIAISSSIVTVSGQVSHPGNFYLRERLASAEACSGVTVSTAADLVRIPGTTNGFYADFKIVNIGADLVYYDPCELLDDGTYRLVKRSNGDTITTWVRPSAAVATCQN